MADSVTQPAEALTYAASLVGWIGIDKCVAGATSQEFCDGYRTVFSQPNGISYKSSRAFVKRRILHRIEALSFSNFRTVFICALEGCDEGVLMRHGAVTDQDCRLSRRGGYEVSQKVQKIG